MELQGAELGFNLFFASIADQGEEIKAVEPDLRLKICVEKYGEGGIRTHGTLSRTHAFQACSLSHSDTSP